MTDQFGKNRQIIRLEETESTNSYMKQLIGLQHPEEGSVVMAEYQTRGRGQVGNSWFSSKSENLLFSLLVYPANVPANEQFILSRITSLGIKQTLDRFTDDVRIKWPNDIYWRDKKIAGILIENDLLGGRICNSVIGIGLNVNQQSFPSGLPNPVSLRQITGAEYDRLFVFDLFMHEFFLLYEELQRKDVKSIEDRYMHALYRIDGYYWFEDAGGKFRAKIENVLPSGKLVLNTLNAGQPRVYAFKEVVFVNE